VNAARWLKFNAVGALGVGVQLGTLALLTRVLGWNYLLATVVAVEAALAHNFIWHERYTWRDRTSGAQSARAIAKRLFTFHFGNGLVSLGGNLALMRLLTGSMHGSPLVANVISIVVCSLVNFVVGDKLVFGAEDTPKVEETAALAGMATAFCTEAPGAAADLSARRSVERHANVVRHANEVALRERQEQQRRGGRKGQAHADVFPDEQRRERPKQIEEHEPRKHALELPPGPGKIEAHARQPI
jgi:putative flippase GtrA